MRLPIRSDHLHALALGSVGLSLVLWIRSKAEDQDERANAERRALFVGLWPVTLHLLAEALERRERSAARPGRPWRR